MNRICVILELPALKTEYDILLSDHLQVSAVIPLIAGMANELTNGSFIPTGNELLCLYDRSQILHPDYTLADYGVSNGMRLMLFQEVVWKIMCSIFDVCRIV